MITFKKKKVIMLPTKEKSNLYISKQTWDSNSTAFSELKYRLDEETLDMVFKMSKKRENKYPIHEYIFQNLYIISNEEIKKGDWIYNSNTDRIGKTTNYTSGIFKIIATTDSFLDVSKEDKSFKDWKLFPQPSQSFIEMFVKEYNLGKTITDVKVPYEVEFSNVRFSQLTDGIKRSQKELYEIGLKPSLADVKHSLKIEKDNTVTIKRIKEDYTLREVKKIAYQSWLLSNKNDNDFEKWFEEIF